MARIRWHAAIQVLVLSCVLLAAIALPAHAEWYVGGYGGVSTSASLKDIKMDALGQRLAEQQFPQANAPRDEDGRGSLFQSFDASDVSLRGSAIYGGKAGYFFDELSLPWFGVELEAFTTKPTLKTQTVRTLQEITYQPNTPAPAAQCQPPVPLPNCPAFVRSRSSLTLQESQLRVTTVAFNILARYPGKLFQPYVGIGAGAFYFSSSTGSVQGRQWVPGVNLLAGLKLLVTDEWGFFAEGKYNRATLSNFDPTFGLSGEYSIFHLVVGIAYHF